MPSLQFEYLYKFKFTQKRKKGMCVYKNDLLYSGRDGGKKRRERVKEAKWLGERMSEWGLRL